MLLLWMASVSWVRDRPRAESSGSPTAACASRRHCAAADWNDPAARIIPGLLPVRRTKARRSPDADSNPAESAIAEETRRDLEQLRYLRTYTTSWSASLTPRSFLTLARGHAKQRAEQVFTLPALVESFRV